MKRNPPRKLASVKGGTGRERELQVKASQPVSCRRGRALEQGRRETYYLKDRCLTPINTTNNIEITWFSDVIISSFSHPLNTQTLSYDLRCHHHYACVPRLTLSSTTFVPIRREKREEEAKHARSLRALAFSKEVR